MSNVSFSSVGLRLFSSSAGGSSGSEVAYSDWASCTPTFSGIGTVTQVNFFRKRQGSDLLLWGSFRAGVTAASALSMTLPDSLVMDTAMMANSNRSFLGEGTRTRTGSSTSTQTDRFVLFYDVSTSSTAVFFCYNTQGDNMQKANGNSFMSNNDYNLLWLRCPIQGWS